VQPAQETQETQAAPTARPTPPPLCPRWIAPGDASAALREGPDGCPFVDLPGRREVTVLRGGNTLHLAEFAGDGAG
ncbi:hypothetical protein ACFV6E_29905, partial [Streptomyces sp. NPDC059785]|uniref:hypothetical protein n=1 Tax=Streptomyces sp. NPDC059785 TaxID=3346945 RepID=UPI00365F2DC5